MNFINRAFKNVTRKVSKSILLTLTFFLIGNLVIIGLGVSNASNSAKILTRKKMRAVVTYSLDYNKIWQYMDAIEDEDEREEFYNNYPRITLADAKNFLNDTRVKTANAVTTNTWFMDHLNSFDFVHLNNQAEEGMGDGRSCWVDDTGEERCYKSPVFLIKSNMFSDMIEFQDGEFNIVDGRFYNDHEIENGDLVCVISQNIAEYNGVSVGDDIILSFAGSTIGGMKMSEEDLEATFEVVGIFSHNHPVTPDSSNFNYCSPYENPDNMIFMPSTSTYMASLSYQQKSFDYYKELYPEDEVYQNEDNRPSEENMAENTYIENVTLLLSDPLDVEKFVDDYKNTLSQFTSLDANNEEFKKLAKPLDTLSMYANFIVSLVVINAIVIISLVTALTLKTREYEIGVLLSIGASKIKVIAQFFIELALVAVLGFTLSVFSGSLIAKNIGYKVLEYQIATSDVQEEDDGFDYYGGFDPWSNNYTTEITLDDLISEYEVTVSPLIIAEIYIMGLGIVLISVIIPSFMIMRYNPKKILMNTN